MSYNAVHSRSYSLVSRKGASVTFSKVTQTYAAETDTNTVATEDSIAGVAVQDTSAGRSFEKANLVVKTGLTLYFVPRTFGDSPSVGYSCTWGGTEYKVADVVDVSPDGNVIGSYVVLE